MPHRGPAPVAQWRKSLAAVHLACEAASSWFNYGLWWSLFPLPRTHYTHALLAKVAVAAHHLHLDTLPILLAILTGLAHLDTLPILLAILAGLAHWAIKLASALFTVNLGHGGPDGMGPIEGNISWLFVP